MPFEGYNCFLLPQLIRVNLNECLGVPYVWEVFYISSYLNVFVLKGYAENHGASSTLMLVLRNSDKNTVVLDIVKHSKRKFILWMVILSTARELHVVTEVGASTSRADESIQNLIFFLNK